MVGCWRCCGVWCVVCDVCVQVVVWCVYVHVVLCCSLSLSFFSFLFFLLSSLSLSLSLFHSLFPNTV